MQPPASTAAAWLAKTPFPTPSLRPETRPEKISNQVSGEDARQPDGLQAPTPRHRLVVGEGAVGQFPEPGSLGWGAPEFAVTGAGLSVTSKGAHCSWDAGSLPPP